MLTSSHVDLLPTSHQEPRLAGPSCESVKTEQTRHDTTIAPSLKTLVNPGVRGSGRRCVAPGFVPGPRCLQRRSGRVFATGLWAPGLMHRYARPDCTLEEGGHSGLGMPSKA